MTYISCFMYLSFFSTAVICAIIQIQFAKTAAAKMLDTNSLYIIIWALG